MGDVDPPQSASGIGIHSYLSGHTNDHIAREEVGGALRWIGGPWVQDGLSPGERLSQAGATQESSVSWFSLGVFGPGSANTAFAATSDDPPLRARKRLRSLSQRGVGGQGGAASEPK
jgi:hypothetical protein